MAKLIFSENVIKEITNISPMVGHEIVVYKKNNGKFELLEHLSENQTFQEARKTFLERLLRTETDSYVGYAVDMNRYLESTHSEVFQYDDFNSFDLTYSIEYQVIDPTRLVSKAVEAKDDALEKLKDAVTKEIRETLLKYLPLRYISDIDLFKEFARSIAETPSQKSLQPDEDLRKIAEVYTTINKKVADVGLQVNKINLSRRLSQQEIDEENRRKEVERTHQINLDKIDKSADINKAELRYQEEANITKAGYEEEIAQLKRERDIAETNHAKEIERLKLEGKVESLSYAGTLDNYEQNKQLNQILMNAIEKAIDRVAGNIDTPFQMGNAVNEFRRAFSELVSTSNILPSSGFGAGQGQLSSSEAKFLSAPTNDKSLTELIKIFSQIVEILNSSSISADKTKSIMSKALHLLGELMLGDDADEEALGSYFKQAGKQFSTVLQNLTSERQQQLRDLINLEELKKRFK